MTPLPVTELSTEQRHEVASWIESNQASLPESVRRFLALHSKYLSSDGDLRRRFDATIRELRRALGITPSSERRRSGSPLSSLPPGKAQPAQTEEERLEAQLGRTVRLRGWHAELRKRHNKKAKRIKKRLDKLKAGAAPDRPRQQEPPMSSQEVTEEVTEDTPVEDIELTPEELAESQASARQFGERMLLGDGADPALQSVAETLMPGGALAITEEHEDLRVELPEELADAAVVKTLHETRVRYDFSVSVSRIELDVEKKVVVKSDVSVRSAAFLTPRPRSATRAPHCNGAEHGNESRRVDQARRALA